MTIDRDALRGPLANVLSNASNYPPKVAHHILGQNMGPLLERTADAVIAHLSAVPVEGEVEWEYAAWYVNHDGSERLTRGDIGEEWVEFYRSRGMVIRRRIR